MLDIKKTIENGSAVYALAGRLDTNSAPALERDLSENLDGVKDLTLDLSDLGYISSAGLRVMFYAVDAMEKRGGEMRVKNVSEIVMEIFEVTGFADVINIE